MTSSEHDFDAILADFKKRLTTQELEDFKFATLEDVLQEADRIQEEQKNVKRMMNMSRIRSFLEAMKEFGEVIEVFLNVSNIVAFIWGPMKFMLQIANTWTESFEILLDAYQQIGEAIPQLKQYQWIFEKNANMKRILGYIYKDILEFHQRAIRFFHGKIWRQIFRSVWNDFKTRFQGILDNLSRHKKLLESEAMIVHIGNYYHDSKIVMQHINEWQTDRRNLDMLIQAEDERKYEKAMNWISASPMINKQEQFRNTRMDYKGTGDWILSNKKIKNWKEASPPTCSILWLNGIPGAGKTILSSIIIDECIKDTSFITVYYYCDQNDEQRNTCISIFKGLLSQMLHQHQKLVPHFHEKSLSSGDSINLSSLDLSRNLLDLMIQSIPKQYIIIDGLDECEISERRQILGILTKMVENCDKAAPGKLRILFVSQEYNDIKNSLKGMISLSINVEDNKNDIKTYVKAWTKKIQQRHGLDAPAIKYIKDITIARAKGMFLFVKLVMDNLYAQPSSFSLKQEIVDNNFPKELKDAYQRIVTRLERDTQPNQWKMTQKLLGWMVCAKRPLMWHEIQLAISMNADSQTVDFDDRKLRVHIRDLCGSLVLVLPGDRVELVHSTAKQYISQTNYVQIEIVECRLTVLCLRYLVFKCFDPKIDEEERVRFAKEGYFAFQDYAIAKWFHHFTEMVKAGQKLQNLEQPEELELEVALGDFASEYELEPDVESAGNISQSNCDPFENRAFYNDIVAIWNHIYDSQQKSENRNKCSLESLNESLDSNRRAIEMLTESSSDASLSQYYGDKRYKCPKLTCYWFHEGFKDARSRDDHIKKHERPYHCTYTDCSMTDMGFSKHNDLRKHIKLYHPEMNDENPEFTPPGRNTTNAQYKCGVCQMMFGRAFILRNHARIHTGERPFSCSECGKAFARSNDCKRHEKIHSRRR